MTATKIIEHCTKHWMNFAEIKADQIYQGKKVEQKSLEKKIFWYKILT